jgi:hypothetical protein
VKINQYCSVCKKSLDMEVVPTDDGEDDGVIWLRCPDCGGFLPKIRDASLTGGEDADSTTADNSITDDTDAAADEPTPVAESTEATTPAAIGQPSPQKAPQEAAGPQEPLDEYTALLAEQDPASAVPYRPWNVYTKGDLVHHLAWDDVGVVVAKETLPGNRQVVKVYFEKMGIARLIEGDAKPS